MDGRKYFIMTSEQKEMLEQILKALDINLESFLLVADLPETKKQIENINTALINYENNLIQLNNRIADVEQKLIEQEQNALLGVLAQNEE